jgi:septal ring factor EnvC (AmiA/AmiB activator)
MATAEIIPSETALAIVDKGELFEATIPAEKALTIFTDERAAEIIIEGVRTLANEAPEAAIVDLTLKKNRAAINSLGYKVTRSKTAIDEIGKKVAADLKELPKRVDATRKAIKEGLDALAAEIKQPVAAYEARIQAYQDRLDWIWNRPLTLTNANASSAEIEAELKKVNELPTSAEEWKEFHGQALNGIQETTSALAKMLGNKQKQEAEAAELARLRAEKEERESRDAAERQVREGAEKARKEAEEREAAESRERSARLAAENAQHEKELAEQREQQANEQLAQLKAQMEATQRAIGVPAPHQTLADPEPKVEVVGKKAITPTTIDGLTHRKQINTEALADIMTVLNEADLKTPSNSFHPWAKAIAIAIIKGQIRHVSIAY